MLAQYAPREMAEMSLRSRWVDNSIGQSLANKLRRRRFRLLLEMLDGFGTTVRILDVGGRVSYWQMMCASVSLTRSLHVTLLNRTQQPSASSNITSVIGDARRMPQYADKSFDVVYSNSTIEHVGGLDDQAAMAREVTRVGRKYCVQTPNFYFPVEPHFLVPCFQFLPVGARASLLQHFALGWYPRTPERREALHAVSAIRLLTRRELMALFPGAEIVEERLLGLVKSFVVRGG